LGCAQNKDEYSWYELDTIANPAGETITGRRTPESYDLLIKPEHQKHSRFYSIQHKLLEASMIN
jgi:hypothetical protein